MGDHCLGAGEEVDRPEMILGRLCHCAEQRIPCRMSEAIIHLFETIDVEVGDGEGTRVSEARLNSISADSRKARRLAAPVNSSKRGNRRLVRLCSPLEKFKNSAPMSRPF
jgi:hypothetical protein